MRTVATLQRLDYPNQRDVFILVLSVTVMYTVKRRTGESRLTSSHFPGLLLKAWYTYTP